MLFKCKGLDVLLDRQVKKIIEESKKKMIETRDILMMTEEQLGALKFELEGGYQKFASIIEDLCNQGMLSPVKNSGIYPRNPPLALRYRVNTRNLKEGISTGEEENLRRELISLYPEIKKTYYLKNLKQYKKDRDYILKLHNYLLNKGKSKFLKYRYTLNERSFEIFNDEKYLAQHGEALLKRLGMSLDSLNCYKTYEAFFYILYNRNDANKDIKDTNLNQNRESNSCNKYNALIIENKDTFMSIMKLLNRKPGTVIGGIKIDLLIYGEGKKIISSFKFMAEIAREQTIDNIYYFGDIDYEGIGIYLNLKDSYSQYNIIPHVELYKELIDGTDSPPNLKRKQDVILIEEFLNFFDEYYRQRISNVLKLGKYIPQEALSFAREG